MSKSVHYGEGDVFAVPLDNGSYALGVVGRKPKQNRHLILGLFFGLAYPEMPGSADIPLLVAADALLIGKCHDFGLATGRWQLLGKAAGWSRESWPMPRFRFQSNLRTYSDDNLNEIIDTEVAPNELLNQPTEGVMNARFVEEKLLLLIDPEYVSRTAITEIATESLGMYDDDDLQDFFGIFEEAPSRKLLFDTLSYVTETSSDKYLELPRCGFAIAAAVIIAARNRPFRRGLLEQGMTIAFVSRLKTHDVKQLASLALRAIDRISASSELKELWEEAEPSERDIRFTQLAELRNHLTAIAV